MRPRGLPARFKRATPTYAFEARQPTRAAELQSALAVEAVDFTSDLAAAIAAEEHTQKQLAETAGHCTECDVELERRRRAHFQASCWHREVVEVSSLCGTVDRYCERCGLDLTCDCDTGGICTQHIEMGESS